MMTTGLNGTIAEALLLQKAPQGPDLGNEITIGFYEDASGLPSSYLGHNVDDPDALGTFYTYISQFKEFDTNLIARTLLIIGLAFDSMDITFATAPSSVSEVTFGRLMFVPIDSNGPAGGYAGTAPFNQDDIFITNHAYDGVPGTGGVDDGGSRLDFTIIHEMAHVLGLRHPGDSPGYSSAHSNTRFTVMSPVMPLEYSVLPVDLQLYDIAALQHLFGADPTNLGSTTYDDSDFYIYTLDYAASGYIDRQWSVWDAGGDHDKFDLSSFSNSQFVDLRPGHFSTIGGEADVTISGSTLIDEGQLNVSIAFGGYIEDVIGSNLADFIIGNAFSNILDGGSGNDIIYGDGAVAAATTGIDADYNVIGKNSITVVTPDMTAQKDTISGGAGDDYLYGGQGNDILDGGIDNDEFLVGPNSGFDEISGGLGNDTIKATANNTVIGLKSLSGVEAITADGHSGVSISVLGGVGSVDFSGVTLTGITQITSAASGGTIKGSVAADTIVGLAGIDVINGDDGDDIISCAGGADTLNGDDGNDTLDGGEGGDTFDGGAGDDILYGGDGNDVIFAGSGFDVLNGQAGNDTITVSGVSQATIVGGEGNDTIDATAAFNSGDMGDIFADNEVEVLFGKNDGHDVLTAIEIPNGPGGGWGTPPSYDYTGVNLLRFYDVPMSDVEIHLDFQIIASNVGAGYSHEGIAEVTLKIISTGAEIEIGRLEYDRTLLHGEFYQTLWQQFKVVFADSPTADPETFAWNTLDEIANDGRLYFDNIVGSGSADTIIGHSGRDKINGGMGDDTIEGKAGNDILDGGFGIDTTSYETADSGVSVDLSTTDAQDTFGAGTDTLSGFENVIGSAYDDTLTGNDEENVLLGEGGDDRLDGRGDDDELNGGSGTDTAVYAGNFADYTITTYFDYATVEDLLSGDIDTLIDMERLEFADQTVSVGPYPAQTLTGTSGVDTLTGGYGDDTIIGLEGDDTLDGREGDDAFEIGAGAGFDAIAGGDGSDTIKAMANSAVIGLKSLSGVETITANGFTGISISGSSTGNILDFTTVSLVGIIKIDGGAGNDTITGTSGADTILGSAGDDTLNGGEGDDSFQFAGTSSNFDTIVGGLGTDEVRALANNSVIGLRAIAGVETITAGAFTGVSIAGSSFADTLDFTGVTLTGIVRIDAGSSNDVITGSGTADTIRGSGGDDTLNGGDGADIFEFTGSSSGFDTIDGGNGADQIRALANNTVIGLQSLAGVETITAQTFTGVTIAGSATADTLDFTGVTLTGIVRIDAGAGNDVITGSSAANTIRGSGGDDTLNGGDGADIFEFTGTASDFDTIDGGNGSDQIRALANNTIIGLHSVTGVETITGQTFTGVTIAGSAAADTLDFSSVTLTAITAINLGDGADSVTGSAANDTIEAGAGDDLILAAGGAGAGGFDAIDGGAGIDTLRATADNQVISVRNLSNVEVITADTYAGVTLSGSTDADTINLSGATLTGIGSVSGGDGADTITGSAGNDVLDGGSGDDTIRVGVGSGTDAVSGGLGTDTIIASAIDTVIGLSSVSNVETISAGGFANVVIAGTSVGDTLDFSAVTLTGIALIDGGQGGDIITGSSGADTIWGKAGNDILNGGAGDDVFRYAGSSGFDTIDGGLGTDEVRATQNGTMIGLRSVTGIETISANGYTDVTIGGSASADTLDFSTVTLTGITRIDAGNSNDTVIGSSAGDVIDGGGHRDLLTGGGGADVFDYDATSDSTVGALRDVISDFATGTDIIDLSGIDADIVAADDQAFTFIGGAAFSSVAGELRVDASVPLKTTLIGDVDGDGVADFEIELTGSISLSSSDFYL